MNELINERLIKSLGQEAIGLIKFDQHPQRKSGTVRQSFSVPEEEFHNLLIQGFEHKRTAESKW